MMTSTGKRKKSDSWSQKNATHFIIDAETCFWSQKKKRKK